MKIYVYCLKGVKRNSIIFIIIEIILISIQYYFPFSGPNVFNELRPEKPIKYVEWSLGIPANENPVNDPTGEKCTNGQSNTNSSVFYLSFNNGGKSERTCIVPAGKGLLIPVMQVVITDKDIPGASVEELATSAKKDQDSVNSLYLKIGNKEYKYKDLYPYRTPTDVFEVVFPDKGIFGILGGGLSKAVADGFYILTEPLTNGTYLIHFKSSLICPDPGCAEPNFAQDIKYNIVVQ